jgi:broad-specificity NMP kinase
MFGAGASRGLGVPTWRELIRRVAEDDSVRGVGLIGTQESDPLPTAANVLFHHFRQNIYDAVFREVGSPDLTERMITKRWREIVHRALYVDVPNEDEELTLKDSVYGPFLDIIGSSPLTVNYNFDDAIERLFRLRRKQELTARHKAGGSELTEKGYESVVDPRLVFRRSDGNILHINGFLPQNVLENVEGPLILNDISFADQLIDSIAGAYSTLLHFLTKHSFLLVGLSLEDETLRHLLRQNSTLNPGHFHYRIHHVAVSGEPEGADALANSHFDTFNLITLYLTTSEIAALGKLISAREEDLNRLARGANIQTFYTFYLAGVPGAGKTTNFRHFASLVAFDEWYEERLPLMSIPFRDLSAAERDEVDDWVASQIKLKNEALRRQQSHPGIGINIIDRCPPDAICFTEPPQWAAKAASIKEAIANKDEHATIVPGCVILLTGDPRELLYRAKARDRQTTATEDEMRWQQEALKLIYAGSRGGVEGTVRLSTVGLSVREVVHSVARVIHDQREYKVTPLQRRVDGFASGLIAPPSWTPKSRRGR